MALLDLTCPNSNAKRRFASWVDSIAPDDLDVARLERRAAPQAAGARGAPPL